MCVYICFGQMLIFLISGYTFKLHLEQKSTTADDLFVTLKPMEIRTFQISIKAI